MEVQHGHMTVGDSRSTSCYLLTAGKNGELEMRGTWPAVAEARGQKWPGRGWLLGVSNTPRECHNYGSR